MYVYNIPQGSQIKYQNKTVPVFASGVPFSPIQSIVQSDGSGIFDKGGMQVKVIGGANLGVSVTSGWVGYTTIVSVTSQVL
jgi:hypothetical protein